MTLTAWPAPTASAPLNATVVVPGSKSLTNRYLILAAIADGPSTLRLPLRSRDSVLMVGALRALGVTVTGFDHPGEEEVWQLTPPAEGFQTPATIDCGLAGTVMRFAPLLAALANGPVTFDGDERARERPMGPIIQALRDLGVRVDDEGRGALPFTMHGTGVVPGGEIKVDASGSSQFVSALLLVAPRFEQGITVRHTGAVLPSVPHIDMTVKNLRDAGVRVDVEYRDDDPASPVAWTVHPGPVAPLDLDVEPDLSNAGPFLAAAAVVGGAVTVPRWPSTTTQGGDRMRELLTMMGARADLSEAGLTITGTGKLNGIDVNMHDVGELAPTIAAAATLAQTPSRLRGIAHLRGHETDRLAALVTEIERLGGQARELEDGIEITPVDSLRGARMESYADHRMATFAAILGLVVAGVEIVDVETTAKTLPDFTEQWT
ncbi:MAG TPA: 3-phosphoshikimate 1-carboxyvinyltransferase, partial [Actinomycetales bacterium]|nr:3-phosphoshikimate 1-carboxyvinyltransferase [Actinomycetales bacterium]